MYIEHDDVHKPFSAHTKESARALACTIEMLFPERELVFMVAMANDKDHFGFAQELLTGLLFYLV